MLHSSDVILGHQTTFVKTQTQAVFSELSCSVIVTADYHLNTINTGWDNTTFLYGDGPRYGAGMNGDGLFSFQNLKNNRGYQVAYWFRCNQTCSDNAR